MNQKNFAHPDSVAGLIPASREARPGRRGPQGSSAPRLIGIGEACMRYGVTARALRFYEARGMLRPVREGAQRLYDARQLIRLQLILKGKQLGFSLAEIQAMIPAGGDDGEARDLPISGDQLQQQIAVMERQMRNTEIALAELRRRYYLMQEVGAAES